MQSAPNGMKYRITAGGRIIGHSKLESPDPSMGVVFGAFVPAPEYEQVRPVFRIHSPLALVAFPTDSEEAELARYYAARDALGLGVETAEGRPVPVSCVHVDDLLDEIEEAQVTVWTEDPELLRLTAE